MINNKDQDILLIEKYLRNELDQNQVNEVDHRRSTDTAFNELYETELNIYNKIKLEGNQELKHFLTDIESTIKTPTVKSKPTNIIRIAIILAAAVSIISSAFLFFSSQKKYSAQSLYVEYFSKYPSDLATIERSSSTKTTTLQEAIIAYQQENFTKADRLLSEVYDAEKNDQISFYKAICQLEMGNTQSAISTLAQLSKKENYKYEDGVRWYLALAYLKSENTEKAKVHLQKIIDTDQTYQRTATKAILNKLSDS